MKRSTSRVEATLGALVAAGLLALIAGTATAPAADLARTATTRAASLARITDPAAGNVALVGIELQGHFKRRPPLNVALSLPPTDQPSGLMILAEDRRTKIAHNVASYVLLIDVFNSTSSSASAPSGSSADQWAGGLVGDFREFLTRISERQVFATPQVFGGTAASLVKFEEALSSIAKPVALDSLGNPTLASSGGLELSSTQSGDLTQFWDALPAAQTSQAIDSLWTNLNAGFPDAFTTPPGFTPPPPPTQTFGSDLSQDPTTVAQGPVDFALWAITGPSGSGAIPINGQVTSISVRGYYAGGYCGALCGQNLHFQDLRPQPNGELQVISTTQAFTLPTTDGTYAFQPTEFFVQAGDYVGFATPGGDWQVLVPVAGDQTGQFTGGGMDMNGDSFSSNGTQSGYELDMQVTVRPSS
jgi:hypothetical protein